VAIIGWEGMLAYPSHVWQLEQSMERRQTVIPIRMASLRGLTDNLLLPHVSKLISDVAISIGSFALMLFAAHKWKTRDQATFDLGFAVCVVVTILVSYHTLAYDLSLLLLPVAISVQYLFETDGMRPVSRDLLIMVLFLLFFSPLHAVLVMREGHYDLFAVVLLLWCWALGREISTTRRLGGVTAS
jgi:hypothetical protein